MRKSFTYSKAIKSSEDIEFGDIQKTCTGLNFMSVLMIVIFLFLLCKFGGYFIDDFGLKNFNFSHLSREVGYLMSDIADNLGEFIILLSMMIMSIAGVGYGFYSSFFKKITFYQYGMVIGRKRIAYGDIKKIDCRRVKGATLNASFASVYAYNRFNIALRDENTFFSINSSEYNKMNEVMQELCSQFSDVYTYID